MTLRPLYAVLAMLLLISLESYGQSLSLSFGPVFTHTNAITPVVNGKEDFENTAYMYAFQYEQFFENSRFSAMVSYSKYAACTFILFEPGGWIGTDGGSIDAYGLCGGINVKRIDLGVSYSLLNRNRKFYLKPFLTAGMQISTKTGIEFWDYGEPVNGPNYFELEPMRVDPLNTTQISPSLGFRTGFLFWKRLDLGLTMQGVYATKAYQKMYLKYQYKGTPQPMAEYESTGTGLFVTLGVGYRFARLIK